MTADDPDTSEHSPSGDATVDRAGSSLPRRSVLYAAWVAPVVALAAAAPAAAASDGPPIVSLNVGTAGPVAIYVSVGVIQPPGGPIAAPVVVQARVTGTDTWVPVASGTTSAGSFYTTTILRSSLTGYDELRAVATVGGHQYYSSIAAIPA